MGHRNRFTFSQTKCIHSCKLRTFHNDLCLKLDESEIPVVELHKFLGVIFDRKLTFIFHLKYLKTKCSKVLQPLHIVAHTEWGANQSILIKLYRSLLCSKLDYTSFIYGATRKSYTKILNPKYHQGLRLVLRAFRTSSVES